MRAYLTRISETAKESLIDGTQLSKEEEDFVLIRLPRDVAPVLMPAKSEVAKGNAVHVDGLATFGIRPNQTNRAGLAMSEGGRPEVADSGRDDANGPKPALMMWRTSALAPIAASHKYPYSAASFSRSTFADVFSRFLFCIKRERKLERRSR